MYSQVVTLQNATGLHARPATQFVNLATTFQSQISISVADKDGDAKSILKVLSLGIAQGTQVKIAAEGHDEKTAVESLVMLIESGFDK
ncbi:MAG: ptsH [Firmicutes bacterium]|nr:ptsH [Bacillota bacterium]